MDLDDFCRELGAGIDPLEIDNELEDALLLNLNHRETTVEGANAELTEPNPAVYAAATTVEVENQRALGLGLGEPRGFYQKEANTEPTEPDPSAAVDAVAAAPGPLNFDFEDLESLRGWDIFDDTITDEQKTIEEINHDFRSRNDFTAYLSDPKTVDDGNQGDNDFEEATATHERGSNNLADSRVSGTHRPNLKAGHAEAVASSQLVSAHSYSQGKDELGYSRNQGSELRGSTAGLRPSRASASPDLAEGTRRHRGRTKSKRRELYPERKDPFFVS